MHNAKYIAIDTEIAQLQKKLAKLKTFRESLDDPDLAGFLGTIIGNNGEVRHGNKMDRKGRRSRPAKHFDLISKVLLEGGNKPMTAPEIIAATGLNRGAISNMLYKQRKDQFEKIEKDGERIRWRLKANITE